MTFNDLLKATALPAHVAAWAEAQGITEAAPGLDLGAVRLALYRSRERLAGFLLAQAEPAVIEPAEREAFLAAVMAAPAADYHANGKTMRPFDYAAVGREAVHACRGW